jgi:hypothetical protein
MIEDRESFGMDPSPALNPGEQFDIPLKGGGPRH